MWTRRKIKRGCRHQTYKHESAVRWGGVWVRLCVFVCGGLPAPSPSHRWLLSICLMTTPPFFSCSAICSTTPLFLISDHVTTFQKLVKVVYSLTSYSRCVVVSWPQCWAVFGWPLLSQPPPSPHPSSTLWPPGTVVWGKKIHELVKQR